MILHCFYEGVHVGLLFLPILLTPLVMLLPYQRFWIILPAVGTWTAIALFFPEGRGL